ncbi:hypothetical protein ECIV_ORF85 [European chub iridovirus]|nr:hypothetical protein ECIV_ORF85 [European chub iridovirus]
MLPIEVVWNGQGDVMHLYPMQTYEQFINFVAQTKRSHRDFLTYVSAKNLQELVQTGKIFVTDALPGVVNQREMEPPDLSSIAFNDIQIFLSEIYIVTHLESHNPHFQILTQSQNIVRDVRDVIARSNEIIDQLNCMTAIKPMDLVPANVPQLNFSPVEYQREHLDVTLENMPYNVHRVFDDYKMTYYVPHAQTKKFFKTRFDFIPDTKWIETARTTYNDNIMIVKYNPEKVGLRPLNNPYLSYYEAYIENEGKAKIDVPVGHRYVPRDECIKRALGQYTVVNVNQSVLVCTSSFKVDDTYEPITFMDFIMNDKYVSRSFSINESNVAHRQRPLVYVILNETKQLMGLSLLKDKTLNVKFKVVNHTMLDYMMHCLSIMWFRYINYREECIDFYTQYNVPVKVDNTTASTVVAAANAAGQGLRDLEPNVFIKTYSRHCLHLPRIVDDVEASEIKQRLGEEYVLEWPQFGETTKRNYVCTHHVKNPFPGVRPNALSENSDNFPFVPCCFKVNQFTKKAGGWSKYTKITHPFIVPEGGDVDSDGNADVVPENVKNLLGNDVVLKPVETSLMSFFQCLSIPSNQVMEIITTHDHPAILACYQELYTISPTFDEERLDEFVATQCQGVLMGEYFYRIAEFIHGLPVYLFNKSGFIVPPHRLVHVKFQPKIGQDVLCVYNYGNNQYAFIENVKYKGIEIHNMFMDVCGQFENGLPMKPVPIIDNVIAQQIDRYGKCRRIKLANGHVQHIKPSPPYAVPMFILGDEYVANNHPIIELDYNEREFRILYDRLKHLYFDSGYGDVDTFAQTCMKYHIDETKIVNGVFYSPLVNQFIEKLSLEEWNNTLSTKQDGNYVTPVDFKFSDYFCVWSTENYPKEFISQLNVRNTLDVDGDSDDEAYLFFVSYKQVCVAQPCGQSLSMAAYVCDVWRHQRYNPYRKINRPFDLSNVETTTYDYKWINNTLFNNDVRGPIVSDKVLDTGIVLVHDKYYVALLKLI